MCMLPPCLTWVTFGRNMVNCEVLSLRVEVACWCVLMVISLYSYPLCFFPLLAFHSAMEHVRTFEGFHYKRESCIEAEWDVIRNPLLLFQEQTTRRYEV